MRTSTDSLPHRLASKITIIDNGCWRWDGCIIWSGYGLAVIGSLPTTSPGNCTGAHRVVYEALVGLIPTGMQLDHLCHDPATCTGGISCRHRRCVNPTHLQATTAAVNSRRSVTASATHCPRGHEYTPENTRMSGSSRYCKACDVIRRAERTPEQIERDRQRGRERAAAARAADPEKARQRVRDYRAKQRAAY